MAILNYFQALKPLGLIKNIPGGVAQGIIWGIMALGVFITFRILDMADMTVDGSFTTGGATTVMLILSGVPAPIAIVIAFLVGMMAGFVTGILHTKLKIPAILAGILTQFALYSINLHIMGGWKGVANKAVNPDKFSLLVTGRNLPKSIAVAVGVSFIVIFFLYWFFGTEIGSSIRATGSNPNMSMAQGININKTKVIGFSLANGLVAISGGLMAQYSGSSDINMGRGAIVIGLAAIIIGEILCDFFFRKKHNFGARMAFVVVGGIIYYLVVILVLWLKLPSNDLKLFTALVVTFFLALPNIKKNSRKKVR